MRVSSGQRKLLPQVAPLRVAQRELVRVLGLTQDLESDLGATLAQCHALIEIERNEGLSPGELAGRLVVDQSTGSRLIDRLVKRGWVRQDKDERDRRRRRLRLTAAGRRQLLRAHAYGDAQAHGALSLLTPADRNTVLHGVHLYAKALQRLRTGKTIDVRPIRRTDNTIMREIIIDALAEYGVDGRPNAEHDADLDDMHASYRPPRAAYYVAVAGEVVVGGAGYAPLAGASGVCEVRKMYLAPHARGVGLGLRLLKRCIAEAGDRGYTSFYLNTLGRMHQALRLYESFGFKAAPAPIAADSSGCDLWLRLDSRSDPQSGVR